MLNARENDRIVFTSCGSESDNGAIDIALELFRARHLPAGQSQPRRIPHVITSAIEHPAILVYLHELVARKEISLDVIGVNGAGQLGVQDVVAALRPDTALVSIMHSSNEIGTIQPIADITAAVKKFNPNTIIHTDAAQSIGDKHSIFCRFLSIFMYSIFVIFALCPEFGCV